jgi:hypothetical protein
LKPSQHVAATLEGDQMTDDPQAGTTDSPPTDEELTRTAREAKGKLDSVTAPKQVVTRIHRKGPKPPKSITDRDPLIEMGVKLKNVSIGKAVANTTATLSFDMDVPSDAWTQLMGLHAYACVFAKGYLGEGLTIKQVPLTIDSEQRVIQKMQAQLVRYASDGKTDQLADCILPLIGDPAELKPLLDKIDGPWRLNCPVDIDGVLQLYTMQESFDLTSTTRPASEREAAR